MDRKIIKKMLIIILGMVALAIMLQTNVKAAGIKAENITSPLRNVSAENFWKIIRGMQSLTGTLGVSQSSSNINCHMSKSTEWGSAAILSASRYGTIPTANDATVASSTTGNYTGVFQMQNGVEYVAGVLDGKVPSGIADKYVNKYTTATSSAISGDALTEATGRAVSVR